MTEWRVREFKVDGIKRWEDHITASGFATLDDGSDDEYPPTITVSFEIPVYDFLDKTVRQVFEEAMSTAGDSVLALSNHFSGQDD